ncbi:MAG: SDR family NAD(P)-dependent oxidoreductase [Candidatus Eisenbacteria bacterium]|uniref:SDR family NAD(P)-dependent oxidoreductase n=1 Tax=Eiseniibacteriota bacterium TaxID=2212470 RepID=A0A937X7D1_UNCEI|nr:SDR family NAD(P)-dependent oxidoreductase [Candidatus Eisenbacteria bacterium]
MSGREGEAARGGAAGAGRGASAASWSGRRVLVTGGAGFIGSHLVDRLVEAGARVRVLDNLRAGREENLDRVRTEVDLRVADLRDAAEVDRAVAGTEIVFHIGANASVPASVEDRAYDFQTNTLGTFHLADAAVRHGVRRIVQASTAAVYGPPRYAPVDEAHPLEPISPYGGSKLAAERLLVAYARTYDFELAVARIFNTYGPRQPRYVAYDLMIKLSRDPRRLEVLGSGEQRRDYAYVDDTVRALLLGATLPLEGPLAYNISGGRTVSIRDLVGLILATLGLTGTEVIYGLPSWKGDIEVLSGDIARLRGFGWQPTVELEEGLRRMAAHLGLVRG